MRISRVYLDAPLREGELLSLPADTVHYLCKVLRLRENAPLILFNGDGHEYSAHLSSVGKKQASVYIDSRLEAAREPALRVHLGLGLSRGERMDYALQKSTELGVSEITPLFTEHSEVRLSAERAARRIQHWRQIIISACEQCGRVSLPALHAPLAVSDWLSRDNGDLRLVLDHRQQSALGTRNAPEAVALLIGPEGGLSETEIELAGNAGFLGIRLGGRIMRTETAPVAALSVLQFLWGDFQEES